jgi:CelD/BcsL family acetyltransferase involved in cellulose biosynthesis
MSGATIEGGLHARVTTPLELESAEIAAWEHLSSTEAPLGSPFLSYHYARAVAQSGMDVRVCVIRQDGAIRGFLPYQFRDRLSAWVKAAEPAGGEMTDYFGLVAMPGLRIAPLQLLRLAKLNYLGFSHLDETQLNFGLSGEQPRVGLRSDLGPAPEAFMQALAVRQKKYIKDAMRLERQLGETVGPLRFETDQLDGRRQSLDTLIAEKRRQYRRTGVPDALEGRWKRALLEILSTYHFPSCRGLLSTLRAGDQWIASHFGLLGNGVLQYWLPVYNPDYARYAPGRLMSLALIRESQSIGYRFFDNGEGDSDEKRKLANAEHLYYRGAWHNATLRSFAIRSVQSLKWRVAS